MLASEHGLYLLSLNNLQHRPKTGRDLEALSEILVSVQRSSFSSAKGLASALLKEIPPLPGVSGRSVPGAAK
jgi:hypothetical protein